MYLIRRSLSSEAPTPSLPVAETASAEDAKKVATTAKNIINSTKKNPLTTELQQLTKASASLAPSKNLATVARTLGRFVRSDIVMMSVISAAIPVVSAIYNGEIKIFPNTLETKRLEESLDSLNPSFDNELTLISSENSYHEPSPSPKQETAQISDSPATLSPSSVTQPKNELEEQANSVEELLEAIGYGL